MRSVRNLPAAAAVVLLALVGCSSGEGEAGTEAAAGESTSTAAPTPTPAAATATSSPGSEPDASPTPSDGPGGSEEPETGGEPEAASEDPRDETAEPTGDGRQSAVLERVEGPAKKTCVDTTGERDVRSGSIVGGAFDEAVSAWGTERKDTPDQNVRLYWVPLHADTMPGVEVVAHNAETGTTVEVTQDEHGDAEQWKYYNTSFVLLEAGTWKLDVTAGKDSGCFLMTLEG